MAAVCGTFTIHNILELISTHESHVTLLKFYSVMYNRKHFIPVKARGNVCPTCFIVSLHLYLFCVILGVNRNFFLTQH